MEGRAPSDIVPPPYGRLFTIYDAFNYMQTSLLNDLLYSDKSVVLSAPTGSGKTVIFELAIVRMLIENDRTSSSSHNFVVPKAIYIAPIKALCSEKFTNWKTRFDALGINCTELTGDTQIANFMATQKAQIVISTPEKWDSLTRRWRDYSHLLSSIQLFIIDEVHLLNEDKRGPILEAIVARMKSNGVKRFIVASATIPNVEDLTNWIRSCNTNVVQYVFDETQRPVPLEKHVLGVNSKLKGFQFDMKLNYELPQIIRKYSEKKATLIFCSTRKSAEMAAINLDKTISIFQLTNQQKIYLNQLAQQLIDTKLKKLVENGIAYHHAGLQYADRNLIELGFREGFLMALFSTSTLAMGTNFPAHLVIIKSTETYICGSYVEYPENMLLQMIGRAGRPQFDTKGVVVILTQNNKVDKYKNLMNAKSPIESHLHKHLIEHLNSEIALNSINNLEVAMNWIRSTYLYIRSVRNPKHYGLKIGLSKNVVEHQLEQLALKQINALENAGLVTIMYDNGLNVQTTSIGKLMAKNYMSFETMKSFRELNGNETLQEIFDLIVKTKELSEFTLRVNEKRVLNALNKAPIRFPIQGRIKTNEEKISCIIQAVFGNLEITAPSLVQESLKMLRIGESISRCLLEYIRLCVQKKIFSNSENTWYETVLNSFIVVKCFNAKLWENSEYASKQLRGIGVVYSSLFHDAGKTTLKSIAETDARTIENILNKSAPFGNEVLKNLCSFPEYEIKLVRKSTDSIEVYGKQVNENYVQKYNSNAVLIVGDSLNNLLLLVENFDEISPIFQRVLRIIDTKKVEYIHGHIIHTSLVGVDAYATIEINPPKNKITEKSKKTSKNQMALRTRRNDTTNDSNFFAESTTETKLDDSIEEKLNIFQFKTPKIFQNEQGNVSINNSTENPLKVATIKPLNDKSFMNDTMDLNTSNSSRIIQRKLTDFFSQRKKPNNIATKEPTVLTSTENAINITNFEHDIFGNFDLFNDEQQTANRSVSSMKSESTNDSSTDSSSIKVTCIKNYSAIKTQLTANENEFPIPFDSEFLSTSNIERCENNRNIELLNNTNPNSELSFLEDVDLKEPVTDLSEKFNIQKLDKQTQYSQIRPIQESKNFSFANYSNFKYPNADLHRENTSILKRQSNQYHSADIDSELPSTSKRQKYEIKRNIKTSNNTNAISLSSFLGLKQTMTNLNDNENAPKLSKRNQTEFLKPDQKSKGKPNKKKSPVSFSWLFGEMQSKTHIIDESNNKHIALKSKPAKFEKTSGNSSFNQNNYETIQSINKPIDLFKSFNEKEVCTAYTNATENDKTNQFTSTFPTNEEFLLWYKVAMLFQKLPRQAMSLKNFRSIYKRVIRVTDTKSHQPKKVTFALNENIKETPIDLTIEASGSTVETCETISSQNVCQLQLFIEQEKSVNDKIRRTAINMINQKVMKRVLNDRSEIHTKADNIDLEVDLENALKDLENDSLFAEK